MSYFKTLFLMICLTLPLFSCSDYSLTFNQQVLYTPPVIFTDFHLADLNLQRCADHTIAESKITSARQMQSLLCPEKDIQSLEGIGVFSDLKILGLQGNKLNSLNPLESLQQLEQLNLANNQLTDIAALQSLTSLRYLNLLDNLEINCQQLDAIKLVASGTLLRPSVCL